ncbi:MULTISPECIES: ketopantoate reductase family protein [Microbacterium]|uniref:2-dehydropantoate 2-reductase n=1 Tax=Microbacterium wangchenii TaxID=2541726 RepID=A0ABX5SVA7_9MICO|nr:MULTISPECIES: 2-dehydropantoate 2-reductase [Microbacterium]MCK6065801.1 2-dehydropantoate 2-reductase [Microbacterium sp. EYE_512]QBR90113.1 2-dehydropantoate 2-reductase [Microbacterium wangchenii]TFV85077.1 2-dehydropantoate 2-reductase [Microbacterium sp. dk485]TXK11871.1 2-dehydropantoate 2-reductase [Microbacterium wangchenii]
MVRPRIAVLGAGANGASVGADLLTADHDVTLIEQWPAHVEAMRADGLHVISPDGDLHVRPHVINLCEVAELTGPFDVVLVLMKAYDTAWAARMLRPYLAADGLMAGVQNGMTTRTVQDAVGPRRTMGAVIECSATMDEPGIVHRHTPVSRSWFAVGALPGGPADRVEDIAALLRCAGTVASVDDIEAAKWMKLVSNATLLATSAILGLPMLDALHTPGFRAVMIAAGNEALEVGAAVGHPVLPIFGLTPDEVADRSRVVETMTDKLFAGFVVPGATTTVLQDWTKGRHAEVDDLNGLVAAEGRRQGVATPVNDAVVHLARQIERAGVRPDAALLSELTAAAA